MSIYTEFQGVRSFFGKSQVTEQLNDNMIAYLNNAFLNIGAYYNVTHPASGNFNNSYSSLRQIDSVTWEGFRANWVWELDCSWPAVPNMPTPWPPDGTDFVNYNVDYPNGRIVFDTPVVGPVQADFCFRYVNVYSADTELFKQIQKNSLRSDINFAAGSGTWMIDSNNRVQLPAIFVDIVPNRDDIPKEIGGGVFINMDIIFHVVSENTSDRKRIMDILANQLDHKIYLYDRDAVATDNAFPLTFHGYLANYNTYQYLVDTYPWRSLYFKEMRTQYISDYIASLYMGDVRATVEIDYGLGV